MQPRAHSGNTSATRSCCDCSTTSSSSMMCGCPARRRSTAISRCSVAGSDGGEVGGVSDREPGPPPGDSRVRARRCRARAARTQVRRGGEPAGHPFPARAAAAATHLLQGCRPFALEQLPARHDLDGEPLPAGLGRVHHAGAAVRNLAQERVAGELVRGGCAQRRRRPRRPAAGRAS